MMMMMVRMMMRDLIAEENGQKGRDEGRIDPRRMITMLMMTITPQTRNLISSQGRLPNLWERQRESPLNLQWFSEMSDIKISVFG